MHSGSVLVRHTNTCSLNRPSRANKTAAKATTSTAVRGAGCYPAWTSHRAKAEVKAVAPVLSLAHYQQACLGLAPLARTGCGNIDKQVWARSRPPQYRPTTKPLYRATARFYIYMFLPAEPAYMTCRMRLFGRRSLQVSNLQTPLPPAPSPLPSGWLASRACVCSASQLAPFRLQTIMYSCCAAAVVHRRRCECAVLQTLVRPSGRATDLTKQ